jgi:glycosyltransferase involved in cell wall biosynthesis
VACAGLANELGARVDLKIVTSGEREGAYAGGDLETLRKNVEDFTRRILGEYDNQRLVHAHDWMSFPAALEIQRRHDARFVAHVHSFEVDRSGPFGSPWIKGVEQAGMRHADRVIVVSRYTAKVAVDHYGVDPAKIRIVHNGAMPVEARRSEVVSPCVVFMGRMTSQKGPELFLDMALRVAEQLPFVRFVMAGKGEMLESLQRRAAGSSHADRIEFPGFLERPSIEELLSRATVCVMPSRSEPFGLVALEAAQFGVPTVLSDRSGVSEVLRSNPVAGIGDIDGFARRIIELLRNDEMRDALGERLKQEAASATWRAASDKVLDVYRGLFF